MIEVHPFGSFVPNNAKFLLLGSFTTKQAYDDKTKGRYVWFYANGGRNQFWPILEEVYGRRLQTRKDMEKLFTTLGMALADIIYQCERRKNSNLDINLKNIVYALDDIAQILKDNYITRIYFTSRFVETKFRSNFKEILKQYSSIELITLPSPSPRYAQMTKNQKLEKYKELLPVI
jgi:hypoxanthine-DNA glycosylase